MKVIKLLTILLLIALCTVFHSCGGDDLDLQPDSTITYPPTDPTEDTLLKKFGIDRTQYTYFNIKISTQGELIATGLKDSHIWIAAYDTTSCKQICEVIDTEVTKEDTTKYLGYGESKILSLSKIEIIGLVQTENGSIGQLGLYYIKDNDIETHQITFFRNGNSIKKHVAIINDSYSYKTVYQWYNDAAIMGNYDGYTMKSNATCCNDKGDTLYITKMNIEKSAIAISYEEGINLGLTSQRWNYATGKRVWEIAVEAPIDVPNNARTTVSLLGTSANIWKCKADVLYYDGTKKDFTFEINIEDGTIVGQEIKATGISINQHTVNLKRSETFQLVATIQPDNATNKTVSWSSSNPSIASISKEGIVTALTYGETTITAATEDGSFSTTAIVTVTNTDEDNKAILASLKGTWDMVKCYGWEYNDHNIKEDWEESVAGEYIFFEDKDGNGGYNNGYQTYYFASSITNNKLILRNSEWLSGKSVTITKLTDTELHITATDASSEENYEMEKRNNGDGVITSSIVGTWKLITKINQTATHVTYKNDGTFQCTSTADAGYEEHGRYKIDGTKLYEMMSDEEDWIPSEILLLNSITLTLQGLEDDGVTLYGKPYSYQRQ